MTAYNVVSPSSMVAGQPEDVSQVLANFNAIAAVLNGGLDNANINAAAAIAASKLAGYPVDGAKVLKGDGTWGSAGLTLLWDSVDAGVVLPTASITTPALPQVYKHLVVDFALQNLTGASNVYIRVNGDSGNNYFGQFVVFSNAAVTPSAAAAQAQLFTGLSGNAEPLVGSFKIPGYKDTTYSKNIIGQSYCQNDGGGAQKLFQIGGMWNSGAAITSLTVFLSGASFGVGRVSVYGEA